MGKLRILVDQDKCVGAGQCVFTAPDIFEQGEDDGIVVLLTDEPDESRYDAVKQAERLCPAKAIKTQRS